MATTSVPFILSKRDSSLTLEHPVQFTEQLEFSSCVYIPSHSGEKKRSEDKQKVKKSKNRRKKQPGREKELKIASEPKESEGIEQTRNSPNPAQPGERTRKYSNKSMHIVPS